MGSQSHYRGVAKEGTIIEKIIENGSKSLTIKPLALDIIWGSDTRYWRLPNRVDDAAELLQVSWLEVSGGLDLNRLEAKNYKLSFLVSMKADAFGWKGSPVYLMVKVGGGKIKWKTADLSGQPPYTMFRIPDELKFTVTPNDRNSGDKLRFGLYEIWKGRWKGGLVIHQVDITPV